MPNEIEIKFRIDHLRDLTRRLRAAKFRLVTPRTHEMNTLYDLPGQPLRKRGDLLRLRKYGNEWVLTHKAKGRMGRHKSRVETETRVSDGEKMHAILSALRFQPTFRYEKFRAEWSDGRGHVGLPRKLPLGSARSPERAGLGSHGHPHLADRLGASVERYARELANPVRNLDG